MPFVLIESNELCSVGVWNISEPDVFFSNMIPYEPGAQHSAKKLQQWASRAILTHLYPGFPLHLIKQDNNSKPHLSKGMLQFNISHTTHMAAAIISDTLEVGIDIEKIDQRIHKVKNRFLSTEELEMIRHFPEDQQTGLLTLCWSIKETVYKWWGKGSVDFAKDIKINDINNDAKIVISVDFLSDQTYELNVQCMQINNHWLTYIVQ